MYCCKFSWKEALSVVSSAFLFFIHSTIILILIHHYLFPVLFLFLPVSVTQGSRTAFFVTNGFLCCWKQAKCYCLMNNMFENMVFSHPSTLLIKMYLYVSQIHIWGYRKYTFFFMTGRIHAWEGIQSWDHIIYVTKFMYALNHRHWDQLKSC